MKYPTSHLCHVAAPPCSAVLYAVIVIFLFIIPAANAERNELEGGKDDVIFYLDAQYRPVVRLERLEPFPEGIKAILAMYALQVGGGCEGHDEAGLKCELTKSLGLGAQCSDRHLNLVRSWFKKEMPPMGWYPERVIQRVLKSSDLQSICYNAPYTATRQVIWKTIRVKKENDHFHIDAIRHWTASADGPSGQDRYQTEYRIDAHMVVVIAHKKSSLP